MTMTWPPKSDSRESSAPRSTTLRVSSPTSGALVENLALDGLERAPVLVLECRFKRHDFARDRRHRHLFGLERRVPAGRDAQLVAGYPSGFLFQREFRGTGFGGRAQLRPAHRIAARTVEFELATVHREEELRTGRHEGFPNDAFLFVGAEEGDRGLLLERFGFGADFEQRAFPDDEHPADLEFDVFAVEPELALDQHALELRRRDIEQNRFAFWNDDRVAGLRELSAGPCRGV